MKSTACEFHQITTSNTFQLLISKFDGGKPVGALCQLAHCPDYDMGNISYSLSTPGTWGALKADAIFVRRTESTNRPGHRTNSATTYQRGVRRVSLRGRGHLSG